MPTHRTGAVLIGHGRIRRRKLTNSLKRTATLTIRQSAGYSDILAASVPDLLGPPIAVGHFLAPPQK